MSALDDLLELPAETVKILRFVGLRGAVIAPFVFMTHAPLVILPLLVVTPVGLGVARLAPYWVAVFILALPFAIVAAALLAAIFAAPIALADLQQASLGDAVNAVYPRLPRLAVLHALSASIAAAGVVLVASDRDGAGDRIVALSAVAIVLLSLVQTWFLGFAAVPLIRGARLRDALRAANAVARGHRLIAVAPTLATLLLVGGAVFSLLATDALSKTAGAPSLGAPTVALATVALFASLLAAPAVHGFLTLAAWRIASRTNSADDSATLEHENA